MCRDIDKYNLRLDHDSTQRREKSRNLNFSRFVRIGLLLAWQSDTDIRQTTDRQLIMTIAELCNAVATFG